MSRDTKLMQKIMLYLGQQPQGKHIQTSAIQLDGYTHQQIASHVRMLAEDKGLLDITRTGTLNNPDASLVLRITNAGYDFIEQAQSPAILLGTKNLMHRVFVSLVEDGMKYLITAAVIAGLGLLAAWVAEIF